MKGFLQTPSPRWFSIPAHRPFLSDLAAGLWRSLSPLGPEALSGAVILIPTKRAARHLAEAFLKVSGSPALLLPQMRALGDLEEGEAPFEVGDLALDLAPAISPWRRRFELAALVAANQDLLGRKLDTGGALEMADALASLLDACQLEEVGDQGAVARLVDGELARHWQISARFIALALEVWPERLRALGLMDPSARRVALLRRLGERWRNDPPQDIIIAAGSTGTAPAAADLLGAIAVAPRGCVVLPGLDKALAETAWQVVDEQHPQGALKRLLQRFERDRADVRDWDPAAEAERQGRWRRRLINEALRPPAATADWLSQIADLRAEGAAEDVDPVRQGLDGLFAVTARNAEEAATVAALLLREALETPDKTVALITHDAALARRVSARLGRWDVTADTSAGRTLAGFAGPVLASLLARTVIDPAEPVTLLAILKHPLTRLGITPEALAEAASVVERRALRGARPADGSMIEARLAEHRPALDLMARLGEALRLAGDPFGEDTAEVAAAARGLAETLETINLGPEGETGDLWRGPAGEAMGRLFAALIEESDGLPPITRSGFADLIDNLLARETVRSSGGAHPRLQILGVLEARLVRADRLVLAGLEEGVWPPAPPIDPFLSRPMRQSLGLPSPERRIGLSAHDFAQAASAPEVFLVHSERRDGAPAVASRWLWRLRTLAKGAAVELPGRPDLLQWARRLDAPVSAPPQTLRTARRPRPTPPVAVRPRELPVTGIERWVRDPYGLYARYVLKLYPLERPDEPVDARARGTAIHAAFERFALEFPGEIPADGQTRFADMLLQALADAGMARGRMARESALAQNAAAWVMQFERLRRPGARLVIEQKGVLRFDAPGGRFTLTAKADRIEDRGDRADILDFKTGQPPTLKAIKAGFSPQLTLTGAILAGGGFSGMEGRAVGDLVYVRVSGGRKPGDEIIRAATGESEILAAEALAGLKRRIARFDDPATPYVSWAAPQYVNQYAGDYDHLARLWEWHVIGEAAES